MSGEQLTGPPSPGQMPSARRSRKVNINTADEDVIQKLPGVPVTFIEARRICMERPFADTDELLKVRGFPRTCLGTRVDSEASH